MELKEDVKIVKRSDKTLIFLVNKGDLFKTNKIGEIIIEKLKENATEREIINYLQENTHEDKVKIEKDVKKFLQHLKEKGFL